MSQNLPSTVDALIDHLDACYPDHCIALGEPLEQAHRRAGARGVVDYLLQLRASRQTEELERHARFK